MRFTLDRIILLAIAMFLAAGLAASELARLKQQSVNTQLSSQLTETTQKADAALQAVISPETLATAEPSVYMVTLDDRHLGTAFVLDRERGILGTAAHVAVELDFDAEEKPFAVVNRFSGKPLRVRNAKIHSGFERFWKLVEAYQPMDPASTIGLPAAIKLTDIAHDGALLFVDPIDAETGENILGPNMVIETEENLLKIGPGDPIAILGFPVDTMTSNLAEESASSRVERGVVASMIAPIDLVEANGNTQFDNLIIHRMAMAPGNSGGPVVNRDGKIVGVNSHGVSSYHSNGDSLAQRADILYDLMDALRDEDVVERLYLPEWQRRLSKWPKLEDALPYALYHRFNDEKGAKPDRTKTIADLNLKEEGLFTTTVLQTEFRPMQSEFLLFADDLVPKKDSDDDEDDESSNRRRQKVAQRPTFVIDQRGQYASFQRVLSPKKNHVIFAYDYSLDWYTDGHCPVQIHHRRLKEDTLNATGFRRMPMRYFPADPDSKKSAAVEFVFSRMRCGGKSNKFTFGVVSWDSHEDPEAAKTDVASIPGDIILAKATQFGADVKNGLDCNIAEIGTPENCARAIKVRNIRPSLD